MPAAKDSRKTTNPTQSHEFDVVVVGGASTDLLVKGARLPAVGASVRGSEFREAVGGKGASQAIAAARLGAKVALIARVGSDARGAAIIERALSEHIDVRAIERDEESASGVCLIMIDDLGQQQAIMAPGANDRLTIAEMANASRLLANARVLLVQLEIPLSVVQVAVRLARAAGARVILDAAPAQPLCDELLADVHLLTTSGIDAEALTGIAALDVRSARDAAHNLQRRGVTSVCVRTQGGTLLCAADSEVWLPRLELPVVNRVGAEDAFAGALAACLARGEPLIGAVRFAHTAAALRVEKLGGENLPCRDDVLSALERFSSDIVGRNIHDRS